MSDFISARTGAYRHHPDLKYAKVFEDGEGNKRAFTVLYAGARDVGIIGPEDNGIVVLDDDNLEVVLDNHMQTSSGYFGPTPAQADEIARIMGMDWAGFSEFCRTHPRYRGSVPDFGAAQPDYPKKNPIDAEPLLSAAELAKFADGPYADLIGSPTVGEAKDALRKHSFHKDSPYSEFRLSWNVKVGNFDTSGVSDQENYPNNRYLDAAWEREIERDDSVFWRACEYGLTTYVEGLYTTYPGDDQGRYDFGVEGRSGGHLVLTALDGYDLKWGGLSDFNDYLEEADKDEIAALYILAAHLDHELSRRRVNDEMAYQFTSIRNEREDSGHLYTVAAEVARDDEHEIGVLNFGDKQVTVDLETGVILDPPSDRPTALRGVGAVDIQDTRAAGNGEIEPVSDELKCFDFDKNPLKVKVEAEIPAPRQH